MLESQLRDIDQAEPVALFLGKTRSDTNAARLSVLSEIDRCLADYGASNTTVMKYSVALLILTGRFIPGASFSSLGIQTCNG